EPVLHAKAHEHAWHHRKMKCHMALVAFAEIRNGVFRPLIRFREKHAVSESLIDLLAQLPQEIVSLGKVLAICTLAFVKVGNRVQSQSIYAHSEPEIQDRQQSTLNFRIVKVEVRLMVIKAMPVIRIRDGIPGPV